MRSYSWIVIALAGLCGAGVASAADVGALGAESALTEPAIEFLNLLANRHCRYGSAMQFFDAAHWRRDSNRCNVVATSVGRVVSTLALPMTGAVTAAGESALGDLVADA